MRVVGIVTPFAPRVPVPGEIRYPYGDRMEIVEESCGYRDRGVSIRCKIRFIEKPGVQDERGAPCG